MFEKESHRLLHKLLWEAAYRQKDREFGKQVRHVLCEEGVLIPYGCKCPCGCGQGYLFSSDGTRWEKTDLPVRECLTTKLEEIPA